MKSTSMVEAEETQNFEIFRDCLSSQLIEKFVTEEPRSQWKIKGGHGRKRTQIVKPDIGLEKDSSSDAEELAEFISYIAEEVFTCLPEDLRTLTYSTYTNTPALHDRYDPPLASSSAVNILKHLDPAIDDTLSIYGLLPTFSTSTDFLHPILNSYLTSITTPPPPPSSTKILATCCEICGRDYIPLTYHHLVPKFVHEKALKRGWHTKDQLNNVAWLCRACHSFVHSMASHEELARDLYTVELLMERKELRKFAGWVGRVRWKAR